MATPDEFKGERSILSSADDAVPVIEDVAFADGFCKALYIGTGGDVVARTKSGQLRTWKNVPSGTELNVRVDMVAAATSAADILAYY